MRRLGDPRRPDRGGADRGRPLHLARSHPVGRLRRGGAPELVLGLAAEAGVRPPVRVEGAEVVPVVRPSRQGGWLLFLLNMRRSAASAQVRTEWKLQEVEDLFTRSLLPLSGAGFEIGIDGWEMAVLHCREVEARKASEPMVRGLPVKQGDRNCRRARARKGSRRPAGRLRNPTWRKRGSRRFNGAAAPAG